MDCDRVSMGWQVWLTPRETRYLLKLMKRRRGRPKKTDRKTHAKLEEWFTNGLKEKSQSDLSEKEKEKKEA